MVILHSLQHAYSDSPGCREKKDVYNLIVHYRVGYKHYYTRRPGGLKTEKGLGIRQWIQRQVVKEKVGVRQWIQRQVVKEQVGVRQWIQRQVVKEQVGIRQWIQRQVVKEKVGVRQWIQRQVKEQVGLDSGYRDRLLKSR